MFYDFLENKKELIFKERFGFYQTSSYIHNIRLKKMTKEQIPTEYKTFMGKYNPSTEIGTSEFDISTTLGIFRKRGATVWHCLIELYNEKKDDFGVRSWRMVHNSNKK